ncbi:MAG: microviridin/marinostatin family tricyclic proteinase inhibitor [Phormidium sp.]
MSREIVTDMKAVPFFARFLEDAMSSHQADENEPPQEEEPFPSPIPSIYTFKFPSDWEDR